MSDNESYIVPITGDSEQRKKIVDFLAHFEDETRDEQFWNKRLSFWWEQNPFFSENHPRGWVIVLNGVIVGFFGVILTDYVSGQNRYKALNGTTWRVLKAYRNLSMSLFFKFYSHKDKYLLFDTSPNDTVAEILLTVKFHVNDKVNQYRFPITRLGDASALKIIHNVRANAYLRFLPKGACRLIAENDSLTLDESAFPQEDALMKDRSLAYLKWFCFSGEPFNKLAIGYFADNDKLTSYMILDKYKKRSLRVIDYYTCDKSGQELLAMIRYVVENQDGIIPNDYRDLTFSAFAQNQIFKETFLLNATKSVQTLRHYFMIPSILKNLQLTNTLAEGDRGC